MSFPDMIGALNTGRVDAALIAEPVLSDALAQGNRVPGNAYDAIATSFQIAAWFTTGAWAKTHFEVVKNFQKAILTTAVWANKNRSATAQIFSQATKIVVAPTMKRTTYAEHFDPSLMQPLIDVAAKYDT